MSSTVGERIVYVVAAAAPDVEKSTKKKAVVVCIGLDSAYASLASREACPPSSLRGVVCNLTDAIPGRKEARR